MTKQKNMLRTPLKTLGFLAILFGTFIMVLTGGWFTVEGSFLIINGLLLYLFDHLVRKYAKKRSTWIAWQFSLSLLYIIVLLWLCYRLGAFDNKVIV